jgi:tetratricopeptide (TPR) repeat protein
MDDSELCMRFPHLQPIDRPPALGSIFGIGTALYGHHDFDEDTNTCVKVRCLCVLGIPLLCVGAYRVVDRPFNYLFLGREPLSGSARAYNALIVCLVLVVAGFGGWHAYSTSPEYVAAQKLVEGDGLAAAGQIGAAAALYRDVAVSGTSHEATARARFQELLAEPLKSAAPDQAAELLRIAVALRQQAGGMAGLDGLYERGQELAAGHADADPRGAVKILDAIAPLAPNPAKLAAQRRQVLERAVARNPNDPDLASDLALVYESLDELAKCEALLRPHAARLGDREGARILGHLLAAKGEFDAAFSVLKPYTDLHLERLRAAEQAYQETIKSAQEALVKQIKDRKAPGFPYNRFEGAGMAQREEILQTYANTKLNADPAIKAAQAALVQETAVVPVALDLGMVRLQRARALADPAARKQELEEAEKTFVAVRNLAGEADEYRLNLAQVYYWLGKQNEGRRLFDEVLDARQRDAKAVLQVAALLRQVGDNSEARHLLEKAYEKESNARLKSHLALSRGLLSHEVDDEITWLGRADATSVEVQAVLQAAQGRRALRHGKDDEAIGHLRQAVAAYDRIPESTAMLNNSAGVYNTLYSLTGERRDLDQTLVRYEKALALDPSHSLILGNTAEALLESGIRDVVGDRLDLGALRHTGSLSLLQYLCPDDAGRKQLAQRVRSNPKIVRARAAYARLVVLAPKMGTAYTVPAALAAFTDDRDGLRRLDKELESADIDLGEQTGETLAYLKGAKDAQKREEAAGNIKRYEGIVHATRAKGGPTFAVAAATLAGFHTFGEEIGLHADADAALRLAEEAHAAAPSQATYRALEEALAFRVVQTSAKKEAAIAQMVQRTRRAASAKTLLAAIAASRPERAAALHADADFQRLVQLVLEQDGRFAEHPSVWSWVILRAAGRGEAAALAKRVAADELEQLSRTVMLRLTPLDVTNALEVVWSGEITGRPADGQALLKRLRDQGVPLPIDGI